MTPASRRHALSGVLALVLLMGVGACQSRSRGGFNPNIRLGAIPLPSPAAVPLSLGSRAGRPVDASRLDRPDFFPPGAQRVGPRSERQLALAPENRTKFPSTEIAASPDGSAMLFHDGSRHRGIIIHWLLLLRKTDQAPVGIFNATTSFDTSWSADSRRFAVTNYCGDNSSEVFVEEVADPKQRAVELRPFIEDYFPLRMRSAPMFVKAYRWTKDGQLVVRGIGRAQEEPYEEFGCEALVTFGRAADQHLEFLSGYVLAEPAP